MSHVYVFASTFVTLWVILDPPGLLPVFIGLTRTMTTRERTFAALRASLVALGVIASFAVFGKVILKYLQISVEALQVSGGLLLLLVALQILMGEMDKVEADESRTVNVAIVPLGTPLLAGPGAIVAIMVAVQGASGIDYLLVAAALIGAMITVFMILAFATAIQRVLKDAGTILLTRIAGVLLAAIAVQMMADGVLGFFG
ncbi:MAG: MarC family protein [Propionibacteriaceae bacterium]|jgi:multiple antibiotic resistance protein|nr:MarC family protein [Propionibacteriaceae bacterium]